MWKIDFPDMKPFLRILLPAAVCGLLLGDNVDGIAKELGGYGADKVMVCDSPLLHDADHGREIHELQHPQRPRHR